MNFIADVMLGRLARLMRFAGYDVEYDSKASDDFLFNRSRYRTLLTRDRQLAVRTAKRKVYFVEKTGAESQLEEICEQFQLKNPRSRCLICSQQIQQISKIKIRHLVPPFVFGTQHHFFRCRRCHRIYWKGTHFERLSRMIQFDPKHKAQYSE